MSPSAAADRVHASRSLLLPGPQPPLSHFGATLLRHVLATGLRYSLYALGLPLPQVPPIRIVHLRLYFDRRPLDELLAGTASGREVVAAILEPGGLGGPLSGRARGAELFHRLRLAAAGRRRAAKRSAASAAPRGSWAAVRQRLAEALPSLNDALLAEIVAALARRRRRSRGRRVDPCRSWAAAELVAGTGRARLELLGPVDPLVACWSPGSLPADCDRLEPVAVSKLRGSFRETYRAAINPLRLAYLELADGAVERGLIERSEDAFFLPVDLAEDLTGERRPQWLGPALASNRREYEALLGCVEPPEVLTSATTPSLEPGERAAEWVLAPLAPLE